MAIGDFGITDVLGYGKLALDIYQGVETIRTTQEAADIQKQQLRRQQQIEEARARRETRIKKATLLAVQGRSGAKLSTVASGVAGLDTSLEAGLTDLQSQVTAQIQQFDLAASQASTQAVVNTFADIGTFAVSGTGKKTLDFTENLFKTDTDAIITPEG